uniref:Uncharacterized protein n=1 Tax=Borely moumouvirus TaxID=2712067 RepID=A0A6G6ACJ6_9VIRU
MIENLLKIFYIIVFILFFILNLLPMIMITKICILIITLIWYPSNILLILWIYVTTSFLNFYQKIIYFLPLVIIIIFYIPFLCIFTLVFIIIYILLFPVYYQLPNSLTNIRILVVRFYENLWKLINLFWFANMNLELLLNNYKIIEQKFYSEPPIIKILVRLIMFITFLIINVGFFMIFGLLMFVPIVIRMSLEFYKAILYDAKNNNIIDQFISIIFLILSIFLTPIICFILYICTLIYSIIGVVRSIKYAFCTNFIDFNIECNINNKISNCCCYNFEFIVNYILSVISYVLKKNYTKHMEHLSRYVDISNSRSLVYIFNNDDYVYESYTEYPTLSLMWKYFLITCGSELEKIYKNEKYKNINKTLLYDRIVFWTILKIIHDSTKFDIPMFRIHNGLIISESNKSNNLVQNFIWKKLNYMRKGMMQSLLNKQVENLYDCIILNGLKDLDNDIILREIKFYTKIIIIVPGLQQYLDNIIV